MIPAQDDSGAARLSLGVYFRNMTSIRFSCSLMSRSGQMSVMRSGWKELYQLSLPRAPDISSGAELAVQMPRRVERSV